MKNPIKIAFVSFCLLFAVNVSLGQKTKAKTVAPKKVDLGTLQQNTYTNDFFELKIEFPFGWLVGDNALESQLVAIQKTMVQTKNAKDQASMNKAMNRVTPLLGGYKSLPGSVVENSNLRIMVENLSATPTIKSDLVYLTNLKATLKKTALPAGFTVSNIDSELIDGKLLSYLETRYQNNHRRVYVIVKKGFAILMTIDAYSQQDFDELQQVLSEADFDYKK